jgi:hypothetical protein
LSSEAASSTTGGSVPESIITPTTVEIQHTDSPFVDSDSSSLSLFSASSSFSSLWAWYPYIPFRRWTHDVDKPDINNRNNTAFPNEHEQKEEFKMIEELATVDQLCGFTAQNASLSHPTSYPASKALNSKSRVLITGVLNPVGLSLALHLHHICGVQIIAGVDTMFPNTVMHRMLLQERLQLLLTNIPKFVRPVILPFVGLDPKGKSSSGSSSSGGGDSDDDSTTTDSRKTKAGSSLQELQYLHDFEPTHIVHLASYSYDVYSDAMLDPKWKNVQSPYVDLDDDDDDDNAMSSHNYLYPIRSSIVSMQQLLQSIISSTSSTAGKQRPQFIYALAAAAVAGRDRQQQHQNPVQTTLKLLDEMLVDSYYHHDHNHHDEDSQTHSTTTTLGTTAFSAVGLRFPNAIYGPWGQAGSTVHDLMERAVEQWNLTYATVIGEGANVTTINTGSKVEGSILPITNDGRATSSSKILNLLYVDDAVDAIVAAMQFHAEAPMSISVPAGESTSLVSLASAIESYLAFSRGTSSVGTSVGNSDGDISVYKTIEDEHGEDPIEDYDVGIVPTIRTPLREGLLRSLAWHVDRQSPYGPPKVETGDKFLQRHGIDTCSPDDLTCHKSLTFMPCSSECNIHDQCLPSVFDPIMELVWNVSDGCDIILYTQSLGYNVEDMDLHAEYMDDKDLDDDELLVCNFAFIPRESDLVSTVSNKVPNEQLAKFGIKPQQGDVNSKAMRERKLDGLNGRLLYRGWILIWVKDGINPLSTPDMSLLKLSPSRFFHPGVQYALFVEENFSVSPNLDDVLFLVDEMKRRRLPQRTLKKEEKLETPHGAVSKKVKLRLPEEPPRRAAILFAPLRFPNTDDPSIEQYRNGNRKLSVYDAAKFMRYEVGYEHREKENASNRRQREYYERIPSYINKNTELRSNFEPWYRYSMRHWVRTRWVLHDFHLEDARQLRCEWYQEHLQWGNDLDQLSFANVMAIRELRRRMSHREPDDHIKSFIENHPELHDLTGKRIILSRNLELFKVKRSFETSRFLTTSQRFLTCYPIFPYTDSYEWHAMETEINKLHYEPTNWKSQLPETELVQVDKPTDDNDLKEEDDNPPLYVRIMSERVMATSRKLWAKMKKKMAQAKAEAAEK